MARSSRSSSRPSRSRPAIESRTDAIPAIDGLRSEWIVLGVLVVLLPTLARTPQTGDGAEVVATALYGGVLHPTGFPLQAWLDRLVVRAPGAEPARAISLLGLAAHAGACGFLGETLRWLGVSWAGRLLGAAAFAFFPPVWALAVQPEVFSLAHLLIAAAILFAVRGSAGARRASARDATVLGLVAASCAGQHPVAVAALPALIAGGFAQLRPGADRAWRAAALAGAFLLPALALYASLPLLRTASPWPDWGSIDSFSAVMRHALRMDYGTFSFSAAQEPAASWGLAVGWREAWSDWGPALALAAAGMLAIFSRRALRRAIVPVLGAFAIGLAILARARLPEQSYSDAYLEKLDGPFAIGVALSIGLGLQWLIASMDGRALRRAIGPAAAVVSLVWLVSGWRRADASHDRTLDLYARGIAQDLPNSAVYVTEGDVETMLGIPSSGRPRYPVSAPLASLPWYSESMAPRIEPRLRDVSVSDWSAYLSACLSRRLVVASSSPTLIRSPGAVPELRGLVYVTEAGGSEELTPATVTAAVRLTPLAEKLPVLPACGHEFSRFYLRRFARGYAGAAEALRRRGAMEASASAESAAAEIARAGALDRRRRILQDFVAQARAAGFGP